MAHVSNYLFGIVNSFSLLLSIPMIVLSVRLWQESTTQCSRVLCTPFITLSFFVMVLSAAGLLGASCRLTWLMWLYLSAMLAVIAGLFGATMLALAVVREVKGVHGIPGKAYKEFRADGYSEWMRGIVNDNWEMMKGCLIQGNFCRLMAESVSMPAKEFHSKTLTPLQSGCCKPSNDCNFQYMSPTRWMWTNQSSMENPDCRVWSNEANVWCFDCDSCKAAVLFHLNLSWMKLAAVNIIIIAFLCTVFGIGCCTLRNNRRDGLKGISRMTSNREERRRRTMRSIYW